MSLSYEDLAWTKVNQLKAEAKSKGIFGMAIRIAEELGQSTPRKYGNNHDWNNDEMSITYDDYGNNITVDYRGTIVFVGHLGGIETYRPDISSWEGKLWEIHKDAVKKIEARESIERNAFAIEMKKNWGIELTSCAQKVKTSNE
jgi:hypothetical protein